MDLIEIGYLPIGKPASQLANHQNQDQEQSLAQSNTMKYRYLYSKENTSIIFVQGTQSWPSVLRFMAYSSTTLLFPQCHHQSYHQYE